MKQKYFLFILNQIRVIVIKGSTSQWRGNHVEDIHLQVQGLQHLGVGGDTQIRDRDSLSSMVIIFHVVLKYLSSLTNLNYC